MPASSNYYTHYIWLSFYQEWFEVCSKGMKLFEKLIFMLGKFTSSTLVQEPCRFTTICTRVQSSLSDHLSWCCSRSENGHNFGSWLWICKLQNLNLSQLDLILSKRKFMYINYEIMKMNSISNATELKVIFLLRG